MGLWPDPEALPIQNSTLDGTSAALGTDLWQGLSQGLFTAKLLIDSCRS